MDISDIYGFIKCDVEAPSHGLYHPMLPYRCRNKLTFPLCRSCVESMAQELCTHAPEERYLRGTWVSEELVLALRKGYRFHRVWETYHYPQRSRQLFRSYVLKFQQAKEHASGWPAHVTTPVRARLRGPRRSALGPRPHALQPGRACHCQTRVELVVGQIRGIAQQNDDLVHYRSADMAPLCDLPTPRRSCHLSREPRHDHGHVQPARRVYIQLDQRHVHLRVYCGLDDVVGSQEIVRGSVGCVEGTRLLHGHGLVPFRDATGGDRHAVTVGTYFGDLTDEISGEYGPALPWGICIRGTKELWLSGEHGRHQSQSPRYFLDGARTRNAELEQHVDGHYERARRCERGAIA